MLFKPDFRPDINGPFAFSTLTNYLSGFSRARSLKTGRSHVGFNSVSVLCGIPILSTPSSGGRERFYDDYYTRLAAPQPYCNSERSNGAGSS